MESSSDSASGGCPNGLILVDVRLRANDQVRHGCCKRRLACNETVIKPEKIQSANAEQPLSSTVWFGLLHSENLLFILASKSPDDAKMIGVLLEC